MSVVANSPSLPKTRMRSHSVRESHSFICLFFKLSFVARLSTVKFVLLS